MFRITKELAELGYLERDPATKRFSLTNKFLLFGQQLPMVCFVEMQ